jgi:hypothetical protein
LRPCKVICMKNLPHIGEPLFKTGKPRGKSGLLF